MLSSFLTLIFESFWVWYLASAMFWGLAGALLAKHRGRSVPTTVAVSALVPVLGFAVCALLSATRPTWQPSPWPQEQPWSSSPTSLADTWAPSAGPSRAGGGSGFDWSEPSDAAGTTVRDDWGATSTASGGWSPPEWRAPASRPHSDRLRLEGSQPAAQIMAAAALISLLGALVFAWVSVSPADRYLGRYHSYSLAVSFIPTIACLLMLALAVFRYHVGRASIWLVVAAAATTACLGFALQLIVAANAFTKVVHRLRGGGSFTGHVAAHVQLGLLLLLIGGAVGLAWVVVMTVRHPAGSEPRQAVAR